MTMKKTLLTVLILFCGVRIFAHTDRLYTFHYDNVTVHFTTGFYYEEIEKAKMIGKAAAKLSCKHSFSENILLDFRHDYGYMDEVNTFISYGEGDYQMYDGENYFSIWTEVTDKYLTITQCNSVFDIEKSLKLIEYSILNFEEITSLELTSIRLGPDVFWAQVFKSISPEIISGINSISLSIIGQEVLASRIYREETYPQNVSYFTANNEFVIILRHRYGKEEIIDTLPDIRYFADLNDTHFFVFSEWDEFNYYERQIRRIGRKLTNIRIETIETTLYKGLEITENENKDFIINHWGVAHFPLNKAIFSPIQGKILETKVQTFENYKN